MMQQVTGMAIFDDASQRFARVSQEIAAAGQSQQALKEVGHKWSHVLASGDVAGRKLRALLVESDGMPTILTIYFTM